jgi:hypothetical protein
MLSAIRGIFHVPGAPRNLTKGQQAMIYPEGSSVLAVQKPYYHSVVGFSRLRQARSVLRAFSRFSGERRPGNLAHQLEAVAASDQGGASVALVASRRGLMAVPQSVHVLMVC